MGGVTCYAFSTLFCYCDFPKAGWLLACMLTCFLRSWGPEARAGLLIIRRFGIGGKGVGILRERERSLAMPYQMVRMV